MELKRVVATRASVAREFGTVHQHLRRWERNGILPTFGSVPPDSYRDALTVLLAARKELPMQRIRAVYSVIAMRGD